jgi:hypothetical protein
MMTKKIVAYVALIFFLFFALTQGRTEYRRYVRDKQIDLAPVSTQARIIGRNLVGKRQIQLRYAFASNGIEYENDAEVMPAREADDYVGSADVVYYRENPNVSALKGHYQPGRGLNTLLKNMTTVMLISLFSAVLLAVGAVLKLRRVTKKLE